MPLTESENAIKGDKVNNKTNVITVATEVCFEIFMFFHFKESVCVRAKPRFLIRTVGDFTPM